MGKDAIEGLVTVITMVIVVAIIAVIVSKNANTAQVLQSGGGALGAIIKAAVAPVSTASNTQIGLDVTQPGGWVGG